MTERLRAGGAVVTVGTCPDFGIITAILVSLVLRRTVLKGGSSMLAMELPVYQRPRLLLIARHTWLSVKSFLVNSSFNAYT